MVRNVFINGLGGKMGTLTHHILTKDPKYTIIDGASSKEEYIDKIRSLKVDFIIDFTEAASAYDNAVLAINHSISIIVGTSGITQDQYQALDQLAKNKGVGCWIIPNFSIGALLMMKFSEIASKFYNHVEITETHHLQKKDKPSGTALATHDRLLKQNPALECQIHSLRLPGSLAEQTVTFGGNSEQLSITHRSENRSCFTPGILHACAKISSIKGLKIGLDTWIES